VTRGKERGGDALYWALSFFCAGVLLDSVLRIYLFSLSLSRKELRIQLYHNTKLLPPNFWNSLSPSPESPSICSLSKNPRDYIKKLIPIPPHPPRLQLRRSYASSTQDTAGKINSARCYRYSGHGVSLLGNRGY